jgi:hypothetical protein
MSTAFIKLSLLFQYLRIIKGGILRQLTIGLIVFVSLWGLAYSIISWIPCYPVEATWNWTVQATCWGYSSPTLGAFLATYESHMAVTMVLDIIVFTIPIPLYFRKDLPENGRAGLIGLLCMAIL